MPQLLAPILTVLTLAAPPLDVRFEQVAPLPSAKAARKDRAVILVHGLGIHPFSKDRILHAGLHSWQRPGSNLVRSLARDSDVFAFAYAQTIAIDQVAEAASLADSVRKLRKQGYRQIVLLGHSAGGLIARQLVEDHPDLGVTKVVQVCSPNAGSTLATLRYRSAQAAFLASLTKSTRRRVLARLVRTPQPRWEAAQVALARKRMLGR